MLKGRERTMSVQKLFITQVPLWLHQTPAMAAVNKCLTVSEFDCTACRSARSLIQKRYTWGAYSMVVEGGKALGVDRAMGSENPIELTAIKIDGAWVKRFLGARRSSAFLR
jgi:hypothetical protein